MKEEYIELKFSLPVSVNKAYAWYYKRHKSDEYKQWEQKAEIELLKQKRYTIKWDNWLFVEYEFNIPIYTKNNKKRIVDVFNYEKALSDFLANNIPWFQDHKIKTWLVKKENNTKTEPFVIVKIKEI